MLLDHRNIEQPHNSASLQAPQNDRHPPSLNQIGLTDASAVSASTEASLPQPESFCDLTFC